MKEKNTANRRNNRMAKTKNQTGYWEVNEIS